MRDVYLNGRLKVGPVEVQEVDLVDTKTTERLLDGRFEVIWLAIDHSVTEDVSDLGTDKYLVTLSGTFEPGF